MLKITEEASKFIPKIVEAIRKRYKGEDLDDVNGQENNEKEKEYEKEYEELCEWFEGIKETKTVKTEEIQAILTKAIECSEFNTVSWIYCFLNFQGQSLDFGELKCVSGMSSCQQIRFMRVYGRIILGSDPWFNSATMSLSYDDYWERPIFNFAMSMDEILRHRELEFYNEKLDKNRIDISRMMRSSFSQGNSKVIYWMIENHGYEAFGPNEGGHELVKKCFKMLDEYIDEDFKMKVMDKFGKLIPGLIRSIHNDKDNALYLNWLMKEEREKYFRHMKDLPDILKTISELGKEHSSDWKGMILRIVYERWVGEI